MTPLPAVPLIAFLVALTAQRLHELSVSRQNERRLVERGAVEHGRAHYPFIVALHVLWPVALVVEVWLLGARPPMAWPFWLAVFLVGQALRVWARKSLGPLWTVRVWVVPGTTPLRNGPYRFLRHPNYLGVALELLAGPLMFGAVRTAVLATLFNALLLAVRIHVEERALHWAEERATVR